MLLGWKDGEGKRFGDTGGLLDTTNFARVQFDNEGEHRNLLWNVALGDLRIEKALPKNLEAVAIGSYVRVRDDVLPVRGWGGVRQGDIGIVVSLAGSCATCAFAKQERWRGYVDELEVLDKDEVQEFIMIRSEGHF